MGQFPQLTRTAAAGPRRPIAIGHLQLWLGYWSFEGGGGVKWGLRPGAATRHPPPATRHPPGNIASSSLIFSTLSREFDFICRDSFDTRTGKVKVTPSESDAAPHKYINNRRENGNSVPEEKDDRWGKDKSQNRIKLKAPEKKINNNRK